MKVSYYLLNPTRNITVLVDSEVSEGLQPTVAARLMELEPTAEQVGFVSGNRLRMAGGEFCGNASMSAAVLLCRNLRSGEKQSVRLAVSGAEGEIKVDVVAEKDGSYTGTVDMPLPMSVGNACIDINGEKRTVASVRFKGITHLIFDSEEDKSVIEKSAPEWCDRLGADALGAMLLDTDRLTLTPLVYVSSIETIFWESSCASGTSAVGAYLYEKERKPIVMKLKEPGGTLCVTADEKNLSLTGSVKIIKHTEVEIENPTVSL